MRSLIAVMIEFALSSAPCFELFSAAPKRRYKNQNRKRKRKRKKHKRKKEKGGRKRQRERRTKEETHEKNGKET